MFDARFAKDMQEIKSLEAFWATRKVGQPIQQQIFFIVLVFPQKVTVGKEVQIVLFEYP